MKTHTSLYPPRVRDINITLIKGIRDANSQSTFDNADAQIARNLHPSLFAELDFMEMSMPPDLQ